MLSRQTKVFIFLVALLVLTLSSDAHSSKMLGSQDPADRSVRSNNFDRSDKFDRSQNMLINLKSAPMSAGYYIIHSYSASKIMSRDLERALNQLIEVDKAYAKSRHKPDNRYLENVCLKVTLARQTADHLQDELKDAFSELKSSIEETIITDANYK